MREHPYTFLLPINRNCETATILRSGRYNPNMEYRFVINLRWKIYWWVLKTTLKRMMLFKSGCKGEGQEHPPNDIYWYSLNTASDYFNSHTPVRTLILLCQPGTEIPYKSSFKGKIVNSKIQKNKCFSLYQTWHRACYLQCSAKCWNTSQNHLMGSYDLGTGIKCQRTMFK